MTASSPIAPLQTSIPIMTPSTIATITTSIDAPIPPTTIPSAVLQNLPTFDSVFRFEERVKKDPSLDQTGGRRDEEKVGSLNQLALYLNQQPEVQAGLQQGLNLDICQPMSLLLQRNLCRLPPRKPPTPDRDWNKTLPVVQGSTQTWISELVKQADSRSSFNELLDTPIDFSNFIMNWLCVDTLTPELLAGPTYEVMRGSCTSLTELEYHLEEVYKATTDQLDWVNPEDKGGRLRAHQGRKRQQFYGFAVNQESALDVYSKKRIIAVTDLKIVEWHNYKHLDWISIHRDDDKIYKFKKGNFKRLRLQDIEDMLLLLVQGKLSNLTVEERFAFNVSLRILYKEYRHPATCGRSSTGSRKLPKEA
nr:hypothetical protein [Tanacetum cinerariifolium]